ncbi:MAG: hypothetical protein AAGA56_24140 [Myxococcota bacterium]
MLRRLAATEVQAPGEKEARQAGALLAATHTRDVVDALDVELARPRDLLFTSHPVDIQRLLDAYEVGATVLPV